MLQSPEAVLRRAIDQISAGLSRTIDGDFDLHIGVSDEIADLSVQRLVVLTNSVLQNVRDQIAIASAAARAKADFLASVSHELRTPLAAVLGNVELLKQTTLPRHQQDLLDTVAMSADVMHRLISDVLDLARYDAGTLAVATEVIDIRELLRQVCATVAAAGSRRDTPIDCQCDAAIARWISSDRLRLTQIMLNLLTNAAKFGAGQPVSIAVTTESDCRSALADCPGVSELVLADGRSSEQRGSAATMVILIRDRGPGIAGDLLANLGTPYWQTDPLADQRRGGSGLGLVITSRLIAALGGRLVMRSVVGHGTELEVHLPHIHAAARPEVAAVAARPDVHDIRILVCDDSEALLRMVSRFLTDSGFDVTTARDGDEAAVGLSLAHYHVLLVDEQMPGRNGSSVVAGLSPEQRSRMKCLLMTAGMEALRDGADGAIRSFDAVLAKPFRRQELVDLVFLQIGQMERVDHCNRGLWEENFGDLPAAQQTALLAAVQADLLALGNALHSDARPEIARLAHRLVSSLACVGYASLQHALAAVAAGEIGGIDRDQFAHDLRIVAQHLDRRLQD